jgi:hypothetical protein
MGLATSERWTGCCGCPRSWVSHRCFWTSAAVTAKDSRRRPRRIVNARWTGTVERSGPSPRVSGGPAPLVCSNSRLAPGAADRLAGERPIPRPPAGRAVEEIPWPPASPPAPWPPREPPEREPVRPRPPHLGLAAASWAEGVPRHPRPAAGASAAARSRSAQLASDRHAAGNSPLGVAFSRWTSHGVGTVGKALADLTAAGELVNPRDKRGYRLPDWPRRPRTKSLF